MAAALPNYLLTLMNRNTHVWLALLGLSVASFVISGHAVGSLVLAAAGLKAAMVAWQFMELRTAHLAWPVGLATLLVVALGLVYLIGTNP